MITSLNYKTLNAQSHKFCSHHKTTLVTAVASVSKAGIYHCLKGGFLLTAMSERAHFINPGVIPSVEAQTLGELYGHLGSCIFTSPP